MKKIRKTKSRSLAGWIDAINRVKFDAYLFGSKPEIKNGVMYKL